MTKLDCNVVNCSYNADNCCRRTDIQVEGTQAKTSSETCCGSFAPKGCGCQSCHTTDVKKDTTVSCEACECKFNEDHACHAGHIGISGGHADSSRETSAAALYAAADRGIWAADCRPASERRKGMEQLTDYSINFPHLHIYLHHVGKNIMIGNFSVAYYGIVIAIGMLAGLGIACWMAKRTGQKTDTYFDLALVAIICSVIGARVYYVIFRWDLYKDDLLSVFNLRQGGLAIYGGVIAAIITVFVFSRVRKLSMGLLCDTAGLGLVLGQVIGRWGNFFNREAFGGYTDGLFAMQLPLSAVRSSDVTDSLLQHVVEVNGISYIQVHPTFLYESLWNLILLILLILFTRHKRFDGEVFLLYLAGYGIGRFWIESLRTDQLLLPVIGYPVSMALAALLVIVSVSWIIIWHIRRHKKTA